MTKLLQATLIALGVALAGDAGAHYIWIEGGPNARLYFGEYQERLHEKAGSRLDEIRAVKAWTLVDGSRAELAVARGADHFALRGARGGPLIAEETGYAVRDWTKQGIGVVKPIFYARYAARAKEAVRPALALDVLPVDGSFRVLAVYFKGEPLAKAKVTVYAPNSWMREYRSDERGRAEVSLPWRGQYVVEVTHLERSAGEFEGARYEALRHRATLTFGRR